MWNSLPERYTIVGKIIVTKVLGSVLSRQLLFALFGRQYKTEVFAAVRVWLPGQKCAFERSNAKFFGFLA